MAKENPTPHLGRPIWDASPGTLYLGRSIWDAFVGFLGLSVQAGLEPLVEPLVVFLIVEPALRKGGDDAAGARQALALYVVRGVPEVGAEDGAGALEEHGVHAHHQHRARQLALDAEALQQLRVGANLGAAVDAQRLADARHQEQERHAGVGDDVFQAVHPVVAAPVGDQQRFLVIDHDEAGHVAARRGVHAVRAAGGEHEEGRDRDQLLVVRMEVVDLLVHGRPGRHAIELAQGLDVGDAVCCAVSDHGRMFSFGNQGSNLANGVFILAINPSRPCVFGGKAFPALPPWRPHGPDHCALMPAALITLAHFAVSSRICRANSCGVLPTGTPPSCVMRATMSGSFSTATVSLCHSAMILAGVRAGAARPYHDCDSKSLYPDSRNVGMSGKAAMRSGPAAAIARSRPDLMCGRNTDGFANIRSASLVSTPSDAGPAPL